MRYEKIILGWIRCEKAPQVVSVCIIYEWPFNMGGMSFSILSTSSFNLKEQTSWYWNQSMIRWYDSVKNKSQNQSYIHDQDTVFASENLPGVEYRWFVWHVSLVITENSFSQANSSTWTQLHESRWRGTSGADSQVRINFRSQRTKASWTLVDCPTQLICTWVFICVPWQS